MQVISGSDMTGLGLTPDQGEINIKNCARETSKVSYTQLLSLQTGVQVQSLLIRTGVQCTVHTSECSVQV